MASKSFTTALTLYRNETFTLEQASSWSGVSTAKLASQLRSRGIPVREADRGGSGDRSVN